MPFEPKIIRPIEPPELTAAARWTDEEFEAQLPGELEFLAAQLRDDAAQLAAVYPAGDTTVGNALRGVPEIAEKPFRRSTRRSVVAWSTVGTLASVVLALTAVSLPWVAPIRELHSPNLVDSKATETQPRYTPVENREPDLERLVQAAVDKATAPDFANPASASTPAVFLQNISGPELEGLFDLWEDDPDEQGRISI